MYRGIFVWGKRLFDAKIAFPGKNWSLVGFSADLLGRELNGKMFFCILKEVRGTRKVRCK